jgi:hypothetical protein
MFYRRRGLRVVLPLLAKTLGWKRRPFYVVFTPQRFDTAKTRSGTFQLMHGCAAGHYPPGSKRPTHYVH